MRFRQDYSTLNFLLSMLKKWKHAAANGKVFALLQTDLNEAFSYLYLELLVVRLDACRSSLGALGITHSSLTRIK